MNKPRKEVRPQKQKVKDGLFDAIVYGILRDSPKPLTRFQARIEAQKKVLECKLWWEEDKAKKNEQAKAV